MNKTKRLLTGLVTAALALGTLTGCQWTETEKYDDYQRLSCSWWGNADRNEPMLEGLSLYSEKNGISISTQYGEYTGFKELMDAHMNTDTCADVMQLNYDWLYEYSPDGEGFYDLYQLKDKIDLSVFPEEALSGMVINGKLNGVPTALNAVSFAYNKTIYDKYGLDVPRTWEDLFAAAKVMKPDGICPIGLSDKQLWICCTAYMEQVTGQPAYAQDGSFILTREQLGIMLDFYVRLVEEGVTLTAEDFDRSGYADGTMAGIATWATDMIYYDETSKERGYEIVLGEYLTTDAPKLFGWYMKPSSVYSIKKDTKDPAAAAKLLDYLANDGEMAAICGTSRGIPVSRSAEEALEAHGLLNGLHVDANRKIMADDRFGSLSPCAEKQGLIDAFNEAGETVRYGKADTEQAARETLTRMKSIAAESGF